MVREEWLRGYAFALEDIRYAIRWALGPSGDAALGARLAADTVPLATDLAWPKSFAGWHEKRWTRYQGGESATQASRSG